MSLSEHPFARLVTLLGATACGKTSLGVAMASELRGSILSADSRQIYTGMDLGTGKDLSSYRTDRGLIPYYLIDVVPPGTPFSLYEYKQLFAQGYADILDKGRCPIMVGGTGMYIEQILSNRPLHAVPPDESLRRELQSLSLQDLQSVLSRYPRIENADTSSVRKTIRAIEIACHYARHPDEYARYREALKQEFASMPVILGIACSTAETNARIDARLEKRLRMGMVQEVEDLLASGLSPDILIGYGLEYRFVTLYLLGKYSYEEMVRLLRIAIHRFAKRQRTWFRGMERRGYRIHWIDGSLAPEDQLSEALGLLKRCRYPCTER